MPRFPMYPSSGTGIDIRRIGKSIRFVRLGCTNRQFYIIVAADTKRDQWKPSIEQLGSYDPIPNVRNEKLVAFNFERIQYWIARGAQLSTPVAELLGLAGFFPVHPRTYMTAWRNRRVKEDAAKEQESQEQTSAN